MPVRSPSRKESAAASPRVATHDINAAISIDLADAQMTSADTLTQRYHAKEEIGEAINEAHRSMSKCRETLRRLRSKLKL